MPSRRDSLHPDSRVVPPMTTPPEPPAPRRNSWVAFALVGFVAGVLTVILIVRLIR